VLGPPTSSLGGVTGNGVAVGLGLFSRRCLAASMDCSIARRKGRTRSAAFFALLIVSALLSETRIDDSSPRVARNCHDRAGSSGHLGAESDQVAHVQVADLRLQVSNGAFTGHVALAMQLDRRRRNLASVKLNRCPRRRANVPGRTTSSCSAAALP
jgi:hypothetical protein